MLSGKAGKGTQRRPKVDVVKAGPPPENLPNRAFVVQFHVPSEPGASRFAGRAEHVISGENTDFEAPKELVDFFKRVLNQFKPQSQKIPRQ